MKNNTIIRLLLLFLLFAGCNCEGPKDTYTIKGRLNSDGIPVVSHRLEFYRVYNITGIVKYEFLGTVVPENNGDYEFSYTSNKDGSHLMIDVLVNTNQTVLKLIFPFNENINKDFDVTERRYLSLRLKTENSIEMGDTLKLTLSNYFPYYFNFSNVSLEEVKIPGPIAKDEIFEWYAINADIKRIVVKKVTSDSLYLRGEYNFPLATVLKLDTIIINY